MTRFEIQDIAYQSQDGVTYRALDKSTNRIVSIRRFLPFGQDEEGGEGLDPEECKVFSSACQQLSEIKHPALRVTILGDTDPIDRMPFIVTEWIDGESLATVLGGNTMDPSMVIDLVRQAIDVCKFLSDTLENEAVWIDTRLDAIIVSNQNDKPTFSFRICPLKWLGTQSHHKDLTGIISMVEALMGWGSKPISDNAGRGLGGWLKLVRRSPQMNLNEAIKCLPDQTSQLAPVEPTTNEAPKPAGPIIVANPSKSFFTKTSVTVMSLSACLTAAVVFFFYQKQQKQLTSNTTASINNTSIVEENKIVESEISKSSAAKAKLNTPVVATIKSKAVIFSPDQVKDISKVKTNKPATLKGVVKSVKIAQPGMGLYISFSEPWNGKQTRVVLYPKSYEGGNNSNESFAKIEQDLQMLVGKTVTFHGVVTRHIGKPEPHYIKIDKRDQMIVETEKDNPVSKTPVKIYTPEDVIPIAQLEKNSPVKLQGILKSANFNKSQSAIVLYFSQPYQAGQLRGVIYKVNFKGDYDIKSFEKFIGKEISLDGVLIDDKTQNPFLIEIVNPDQISFVSK